MNEKLIFVSNWVKEKFFEGLVDENKIKNDGFEIFKHFVTAQDKINLNNEFNILKTHNAAVSIKNDLFTNPNNSCGAVYIVRDPRTIVCSLASHSKISIEQAVSDLFNENNFVKFFVVEFSIIF